MERPHPGQKAAESGIWAAHSGHDFNLLAASSIAGNISKPARHDKSKVYRYRIDAGTAKEYFRAD
jgi:hypothetical protein